MKILIIQTAFIGDVILATPVIAEMYRLYPSAEIDVLVRKGNESLLENNPAIHQVLIWDKKSKKSLNLLNILKTIRSHQYDIVINLQRFLSTGILTAFSGAKEKIGFSKNPLSSLFTSRIVHEIDSKQITHETGRNLKLIEKFGAKSQMRPSLFPSGDDFKKVASYKGGSYFCLAPTSVWYTKQMPAKKWNELIQLLRQKRPDSPIYLLGGPADLTACENIKSNSPSSNLINLAGKLTFLQTAALMKDATMNYVNDSAPLHITSAMNAPVVAFYCSTIPAFGFGPLSDNSKIIEVNGLPCRPCGLHGHRQCPEGHFKCGFDLDLNKAMA